jgi:hypothetical protein
MALTITEKFRYGAGGKQFVYVSVLHDETTSTFTAASVGLTYVENVFDFGFYSATQPADTSVTLYHMFGTVGADKTTVGIGYPMAAGSKSHHLLIGW